MNPFADFDAAPSLDMAQLALAFVFLTSYGLALGSFCTPRGKLRAAAVAVLSMALFSATITPWAMGIVWAALAVGGMGAFVAVAMLTSRLLGVDGMHRAAVSLPEAAPVPARATITPVQPAYTAPGRL